MERQVAALAQALPPSQGVIAATSYHELFSQPALAFFPCNFQRSRYHPLLRRELRQHVKTFKPDLVHAHGLKATMLAAMLKRHFPELQTLATVHGTKRRQRALARMDHLIAVSEGVRQALYPLNATTIHNALAPYQGARVDRATLCRLWGLDPQRPLIAAAGRLVSLKRYAHLIRAANQAQLQLLLFGEGPLRTELEALAGPTVRLCGHTEALRAQLAAVDLLVICSEREGMSLSMLEALEAGTPVLSTPVSGTHELLPAGALIHDIAPAPLAAQLQRAVADLTPLRAAFQSTFERVRQEFDITTQANRTQTVYQSIVFSAQH